jgi:ATP-dependent phosphofructokinase / diphosphate-dependent phosphofructokinase
MVKETGTSRRKTLAILVGGGPAPGINGVIRAVTIESLNSGLRVIGCFDGFHWLMQGDATRVTELPMEMVSRIHFLGGSILRTSRDNPTKDPKKLENVLRALTQLDVDYLITIGGDDTAYSAHRISDLARDQFQVAHVPKTIDNDLPLAGDLPTFGFETARHVGAELVRNLMEDAQTTNRWYIVVTMGRKAGHLALGIGKAAGATMIVIGEEFRNHKITFATICDIIEASTIKRLAMGRNYGVAVMAEGLLDLIDKDDLTRVAELDYDAHGNLRFSEIDLGRLLKNEIVRRFKERDFPLTVVSKDVGYELRCAPPIPFDREYTQDLGYAAVKYLLDGGTGAIVSILRGQIIPVYFKDLADEKTGRLRIRTVDIDSDSYKVALKYMVRLNATDFADVKQTSRLAVHGKMSREQFEARFRYLLLDPPIKPADHMAGVLAAEPTLSDTSSAM